MIHAVVATTKFEFSNEKLAEMDSSKIKFNWTDISIKNLFISVRISPIWTRKYLLKIPNQDRRCGIQKTHQEEMEPVQIGENPLQGNLIIGTGKQIIDLIKLGFVRSTICSNRIASEFSIMSYALIKTNSILRLYSGRYRFSISRIFIWSA